MKTSFVSSSTVSHALRHQVMRMQTEITKAQRELVTGKVADTGLALGARSGISYSISRDIARLESLLDSNGLASERLAATQHGLQHIGELAQEMLATLTGAVSNPEHTAVIRAAAENTLAAMTSVLNTSLNGEYLFAGINTDVRPFEDFSDPASPAKQAFDEFFEDYFGFPNGDDQAAQITGDEMKAFLQELEASFLNDGWHGVWSHASDQKITTRITLNENAETSATANNNGFRRLAMVGAALSDLLRMPLSESARKALYEHSIRVVSQAIADVGQLQSEVGLVENRISQASERVSAQIDLFKSMVGGMENIDPYEAATRVNELLTQIETAYALTARIQQLSLLRHLP